MRKIKDGQYGGKRGLSKVVTSFSMQTGHYESEWRWDPWAALNKQERSGVAKRPSPSRANGVR